MAVLSLTTFECLAAHLMNWGAVPSACVLVNSQGVEYMGFESLKYSSKDECAIYDEKNENHYCG